MTKMPETNLYYHPDLTIPELLDRAIKQRPDLSIGFYDKFGACDLMTYQELRNRARQIATGLSNLGLGRGDRLIIATQNNRETVELLWGAFLLGVVPTILQPPATFSGYNPSVVKLRKVISLLGNPYVFMSSEVSDSGELPLGIIKHAGELDCTGTFTEPHLKPEDLAFIQFSSGSTGDPKGIMLTHRNLMVNIDAIRHGAGLQPSDIFGNWMPLYHDMGLIGYHLTPIYMMIPLYQLETIDFIMNPGLWLNLMSQYSVSISGSSNFGLALVMRHLSRKKQPVNWDFSAMKALLNGAEPISVRIMHEFIAALQPHGFRAEAMMPVYGMAEATLAITFADLLKKSVVSYFDPVSLDRDHRAVTVDAGDPSARVLSEVGKPIPDIRIRIVDQEDRPVGEDIAGHIQVSGPSVTAGYYENPEATSAAFCGEWLRTGDIGFIHQGRLYISGRFKDIIFRNGRHYFANDIEEMAVTIDEIKHGKVCFGGTTDKITGNDKVIAFVAGIPDSKAPETFGQLRALLRSSLGITTDEMVLLKSNEIPKTSSGKLQRYKLMQSYINGEFTGKILKGDSF